MEFEICRLLIFIRGCWTAGFYFVQYERKCGGRFDENSFFYCIGGDQFSLYIDGSRKTFHDGFQILNFGLDQDFMCM